MSVEKFALTYVNVILPVVYAKLYKFHVASTYGIYSIYICKRPSPIWMRCQKLAAENRGSQISFQCRNA